MVRTTSSPVCRERRASSCSTATSGETYTEDIGEDNRVALYIPGHHGHGFEALTDILFCYHVTAEYDPADPDEQTIPWNDPRVVDLWSTSTPTLSARDAAVAS